MMPRRAPIHSPPTRRQRHRPNQSAELGARRTDERACKNSPSDHASACIRWARATLRKQEDAIRDLAIRAEVHSNQAIRKIAGHFQQKTVELHAVNRSFEEMRTRLVTEIDRLEELKGELEFNHAAAQSDESLKDGKVSVDNIQALTAAAQRLATDLQNLGGTVPVAATPGYAAKPVEAAKDLTPPPPSNASRLLAPGKPFQAAKNLTTTPPSNAPRPLTPGTTQSKPTTLR